LTGPSLEPHLQRLPSLAPGVGQKTSGEASRSRQDPPPEARETSKTTPPTTQACPKKIAGRPPSAPAPPQPATGADAAAASPTCFTNHSSLSRATYCHSL